MTTVALTVLVTLVAVAGLLLRSFWEMRQVDLGFSGENIYTAEIPLPSFANDTAGRAPLFYSRVLEEIQAQPGVSSAAIASSVPFGDGPQYAAMEVEEHPTPAGGEPPIPHVVAVTEDFHAALRIPLKQGRGISEDDRSGTMRVGLIDEAAARELWPVGNPVGKRIRYVWNNQWITIVGVVGNVKRDSMSGRSEPTLYIPVSQSYPRPMRVVVESPVAAGHVAAIIRSAVARVDASVPVSEVRNLDGIVLGSASRSKFAATVLTLFAVIALLLGATGIYGVLSTSVARRTREFGVRMALGATSSQVLRMVLRQGLVVTASGVAIGAIGVVWTAGALRGMLFGVAPTDPMIMTMVALVLSFVALVSSAVPALRAGRMDPLRAIREE